MIFDFIMIEKFFDSQPNASGSSQDEKILIVDDNPDNLYVMQELLSGRGYQLFVAKNGESALNIVDAIRPKLILLDILMPGEMNGFQVCKQIKSHPEFSKTVIIFLSSLNDVNSKVKGLKIGAVDYISKPFQGAEVIARVETQLKLLKLESRLERKNRQLEIDNQRILNSMREGILGLDAKGLITFSNGAASLMTGYNNSLVGKNIQCLISCVMDNTTGEQELCNAIEQLNNVVVEGECYFNRSNGSSFPVDCSFNPIQEGVSVSGGVVVFRDITEKKRQQEVLATALRELEEQKDRIAHISRLSSMGEMASGFAHEVNQPLTAINTYAQLCTRYLSGEKLDLEELKECVEKISTQAQRAGGIISRISNFVKKNRCCKHGVDCNNLVREVERLAEVDIKKHNIEIVMNLKQDLPLVYVDSIQIQQVLLNLVRNAMEALSDSADAVTLPILITTERINGAFVKISVQDQGDGVKDEDFGKLFTPFFTTKSDGTGIGLSVCQSIVQEHGGSIRVEKKHPRGMCFWFTLPIYDQ